MVLLKEIKEDSFRAVCNLKVGEGQTGYVAPAVSILASAYVMRNQNPQVYAVSDDEMIVGVIMTKELYDEPACYTIEQFLIDSSSQKKGYGKQALALVLGLLSKERKYDIVEICVKKENERAVKMYKNAGFIDTGYVDSSVPDSYIVRYTFRM